MRVRELVLAVTLAAGGAACGGDGSQQQASVSPRGRTYLSTAVEGHALVPGTRITLRFGDDGTLGASAGCNSIGGEYRIDDDRLVTEQLATTEMGCDAPRHAQDEWLAALLSARPSVRVDGDTLTISDARATVTLLDRELALPDKPLRHTQWFADTVLDGETASSAPGRHVWISFRDDGTFRAHDGCNEVGGTFSVTDDTLTVGELSTTDRACADEVEAGTVLDELLAGRTMTYGIDADRLTLRGPHGKGVVFAG
jgi:heat shock protein HslJ